MKQLSVVWDMTTVCPFNCPICCMGAKPAGESDGCPELDYGEKYAVVGQLRRLAAERSLKVDLSGGEIMTDVRNLDVAEEISQIIGRDNLGISTSGYSIDDAAARRISRIASEVELTMDTLPGVPYRLRPLGYAKAAARAVPLLKKHGIHTGIQTVLARSNSDQETLCGLYRWMCENQVDEWSLLRFYPSGRGADFAEEALSDDELLFTVQRIQELDRQNPAPVKPALHFHYTMPGHDGFTTQCRCVKRSIGIFPDGTVTACFWGADQNTRITDDRFYLGDIRRETLADILKNPRSRYWLDKPHTCALLRACEKEDGHVFTPECLDVGA